MYNGNTEPEQSDGDLDEISLVYCIHRWKSIWKERIDAACVDFT